MILPNHPETRPASGGMSRLALNLLASLAAAALALPPAARASTPVPVIAVPAGAVRMLRVPVSGVVTARCTVGQEQASGSFGEILDTAGGGALARSLSLPLAVNCNAPFEAVVSSQRGGLAFEGEPASGFAALVPYAMTLDLPVAGAGLGCESAAMHSVPGQDTSACRRRVEPGGPGLASGTATLRLSTRPGGLPLLMGRYSDTITVRLAPRMGG